MKVFALLSFVSTIYAQSSTSTASGPVRTIVVGQNGLKFTPDSVTVPQGSKVVFQFWPGSHSATQSNYDNPCSANGTTGFNSNFVLTNNGPAVSFLSRVRDISNGFILIQINSLKSL
jgi:plastocyanin